ncbi:esterase/lipase family protein [Pseudomonas brassicacearum]|uniref:esterase/lipase family protein n=1 Tax=Pseudomonas brassicacearum TaxID=930166 RepID=UPI00025FECE8|nr:triacylglycerol lipase [Pseudomonas brassicacearum]EIK64184.1 triacylglycerol lipase [Pseudomonas fluorescens Q8r1-96]KAB0528599.1 triacylglycerol lipase [Pseudomonas brassicacearum subsp. brassicacearum]NJP59179.1 triacylglycerol lipase [Pseudomonas brassicacearum]QEO78046.1 triacylglycerol lipase [Pseudomonas brassicacearum]SDP18432.1 triacylglycerol lipase [Pseudomonas brassicacearum]
MQRNATTQFPILLVHGLFGFDRIGGFELFHGIKQALRAGGARVFIPYLSATHCNEARGEQLLAQIDRVLAGTGAARVNLIGHSQGALAVRYAAALAPDKVASVTSVSGPNHGSELADFLRKALTPGRLPGHVARDVATLFADFISLLDGQAQLSPTAVAALATLTTEGVGAFNDKYPQGLPKHWGGNGPDRVNGVRYYSWSGTLPEATGEASEPLQGFCRAFSDYFITEAEQNDGLVGRFSSHLGKVIRSDYPMDHMEAINPGVGTLCKGTDPTELYLRHAERLRKAGL